MFLLVEWTNRAPKQYSVVSLDQVVDGSLKNNCGSLVGQVVDLAWERKSYPALILEFGEEAPLTTKADELALTASIEKTMGPRKVQQQNVRKCQVKSIGKNVRKRGKMSNERASAIDRVLNNLPPETENPPTASALNNLPPETENPPTASALNNLLPETENPTIASALNSLPPETENPTIALALNNIPPETENPPTASPTPDDTLAEAIQPDKYKMKYRNLLVKYKDLKSRHKNLLESKSEKHEVELYPNTGVMLAASDLAAIEMASSKPSVVARNLFRRLFTATELSSHSLLGKRCNANSNSVPLPMIDPVRREAVIRFVLKREGFDESPATGNSESDKIFLKSKKNTNKEIVKSLSDFLREENKKRRGTDAAVS